MDVYQIGEDGLPMIGIYADHELKNDQDIGSSEAWEPGAETPVDPRLDWVVGRRGVPYHDQELHPGEVWIGDQVSADPYNQRKWIILEN